MSDAASDAYKCELEKEWEESHEEAPRVNTRKIDEQNKVYVVFRGVDKTNPKLFREKYYYFLNKESAEIFRRMMETNEREFANVCWHVWPMEFFDYTRSLDDFNKMQSEETAIVKMTFRQDSVASFTMVNSEYYLTEIFYPCAAGLSFESMSEYSANFGEYFDLFVKWEKYIDTAIVGKDALTDDFIDIVFAIPTKTIIEGIADDEHDPDQTLKDAVTIAEETARKILSSQFVSVEIAKLPKEED